MLHRGRLPGERGALAGKVAVAVVLLMLLGAAASYHFDLGRRLGIAPERSPAAVAPPPGLQLPAPSPATPVARALAGGHVRPTAVRRALTHLLSARRLGRQVGVFVGDAAGRPVFRSGPAVVTPASTTKLLTTTAALHTLGPEHRFTTSVVGHGRRITLVGGGDPLLASRPLGPSAYPHVADVRTLARLTAKALHARGRHEVALSYDDSLFTGPTASPAWEPDYIVDDVVSPITALWVDEGSISPGDFRRSANPARAAASEFAAALRKDGIRVAGRPSAGRAPAGGRRLAAVQSAPLAEVVQYVLETSDNEGAEVLARQVAIREGAPASFRGAARSVLHVVAGLGVPLPGAVLHDGSGLARGDRLAVRTLGDVLAVAAQHADLSVVPESLPVAGFSGSLTYRFQAPGTAGGLGDVRAKTGTLTGVHGLAGVVTSRDGAVMIFAVVADRVRVRNTLFARDQLDRITAALADCRCS